MNRVKKSMFVLVGILCFLTAPRFAGASAEGKLYAGGNQPGVVYRYAGGTDWEVISTELGFAVLSLGEYNGQLYAGTTTEEWEGIGKVYRNDGAETWTQVGGDLDMRAEDFAVWNGRLYVATMYGNWNGGRLYRYDDANDAWELVADSASTGHHWSGFRTMHFWEKDNALYIGDLNSDMIARYDGTTLQVVMSKGRSCIWDIAPYKNSLYAGAYRGWLYDSSDGFNWNESMLIPDYRNIWALQEFQDHLYLGMDWTGQGAQEGQLWKYDGTGMEKIWATQVGNSGEGIISMETDGVSLFIGMGMKAGYWGNPGTGKVFSYDGTEVTRISEVLGQGVHDLLVAELTPPEMEISGAFVKPSPTLPGGTVLAYLTIENTGATGVSVSEKGFVSMTGLPGGWTYEFIDVGKYASDGAESKTCSAKPGETCTVVAAITVPADAPTGSYELSPSLNYGFGDRIVEFSSSGDMTIEVKQKMKGEEMASYRQAQAAARQIRALDRNIENGVITTSIDLTYVGIDGEEKTVTIRGAGGYARHYVYDYYENHQDTYYKYPGAYGIAMHYEYIYDSHTGSYYYRYKYDDRPYYSFDMNAIPPGSEIHNAKLTFYTGYGYPDNGDFYVDIYSMENNPSAAEPREVFEDAGDGKLYINDMLVKRNSTYTLELSGDMLNDFISSSGGAFSIGVDLVKELSSYYGYEYNNDYRYEKYYYSYIYTSNGQNPSISTDTLQFTDPEEAMHIVLGLNFACNSTEASELAAYINEKYYSIGSWKLAPGIDHGSEGNSPMARPPKPRVNE